MDGSLLLFASREFLITGHAKCEANEIPHNTRLTGCDSGELLKRARQILKWAVETTGQRIKPLVRDNGSFTVAYNYQE